MPGYKIPIEAKRCQKRYAEWHNINTLDVGKFDIIPDLMSDEKPNLRCQKGYADCCVFQEKVPCLKQFK